MQADGKVSISRHSYISSSEKSMVCSSSTLVNETHSQVEQILQKLTLAMTGKEERR